MLLTEYALEDWKTTLGPEVGNGEVIDLYLDHATHERFHAEFKTGIDLSRPSLEKFVTNHLMCALAEAAINLMCIVDQHILQESDSSMRKTALRCVKTVMQEVIFKTAHIVGQERGWVPGPSGSDSGFAVFERVFDEMKAA